MSVMKKYSYILVVLAAAFFASCEKTLDLEYDNASDAIMVVEGNVSNDGIYVYVNGLSNVTDSVNSKGLADAIVTVSGSDGYEEQLEFGEGRYFSPTNAKGVSGVTYTLHVKRGNNECYAKSTMPELTPIDSVEFKWMPIFADVNIFMLYVYLTDNPDSTNYYFYNVSRDGKTVEFHCAPDEGLSDEYNSFYIGLNSEKSWKENEKEKQKLHGLEKSNRLYSGNKFEVALRTVDYNTYRYFSSGDFNGNGVNPTTNLVGNNCVGYFSAYAVDKRTMVMPEYEEALKMQ